MSKCVKSWLLCCRKGFRLRRSSNPRCAVPSSNSPLGALSAALQSENFNTVFANFGLDPRDGAAALNLGDGIGAFLQAVQARADRGKSQDGDKMEEDDFYN